MMLDNKQGGLDGMRRLCWTVAILYGILCGSVYLLMSIL
jgi:hypothetical protein